MGWSERLGGVRSGLRTEAFLGALAPNPPVGDETRPLQPLGTWLSVRREFRFASWGF